MHRMKNLKGFLLTACAVVFTIALSYGQTSVPPGSASNPPCWPPPCIPIDGGVSFLAAAGLALGLKVLYDKKNND